MKTIYLFLLLALAATGCGEDVNKASQEAGRFYEVLKSKKYEATFPFLDSSLTNAISQETWLDLCKMRDEQGAIKDYKETNRELKIENGLSKVILEYEVSFEKKKFYEELSFIQRGNDYKIAHYVFDAQPLAVARENQKKALSFVEQFYKLMGEKNYEAIVNKMLDAEALQANPAADWLKLFHTKDSLLGSLTTYDYHDTRHRPRGEGMAYLLHYSNSYQKHPKVKEEFFLVQYEQEFKILSYFYEPVSQ